MTSGEVGSPETSKTSASNKISTPGLNNNYACPLTPIASAKRPRPPGSRSSASHSKSGSLLNGISERSHIQSVVNGKDTPVRRFKIAEGSDVTTEGGNFAEGGRSSAGIDQMSPMHPVKPVVDHSREPACVGGLESNLGNEIDNDGSADSGNGNWIGIFSPALNFLKSNEDCPEEKLEDSSSKPLDIDGDGDVTMTDRTANASSEAHQSTYSVSPCYLPHPQEDDAHENEVAIVHDVEPSTSIDESIDDNSCSDERNNDDDEIEDEEFNPYLFIKSLPEYASVVPYPQSKICLPPKDPSSPPITLVLDLDETLVHCTVEPIPDADMIFPVTFNGIQYKVHVRTRPYLMQFLAAVSKKFEVVVFTASQRVYANELLKRIDPDAKYIQHRIFREACLLVEGNYLKDLNVLNRNLATSVLVDNSPHAFGYQVDNGIPIESWFDDPGDSELLKLEHFLETLHGVNDVRAVVRSKFQTYKQIRDA